MDLFIAFAGGFVAALLGSMAGGGAGFFSLYPLIFLGLPLNVAIATNGFGGIGFFAAIRNFAHKGLIKKEIFFPLLIIGGIGTGVGTFLLIELSEIGIKVIVTLVTVPIFLLMAFKKGHSTKESPLWKLVYFFSSLYSGILGAGAGFVRMFALINLRKISPLQAAANGFVATLPFAILSVGALLYAGLVDLRLGAPLFVGNLLGAHLGSKVAIKKGNDFVRRILLFLMIVTLIVIWIR